MRTVLQRVKKAEVKVKGSVVGKIAGGWLAFIAISNDDDNFKAEMMADKIINLRAFDDEKGKMNISLKENPGSILAVSQFTLYADCRKGHRPSFAGAALPDKALPIYNHFVNYIKSQGIKIESGIFGAMMEVELINDGPVTFILDI